MTLLFIDGFDAKDTLAKWTGFTGSSSSTTRFGTGFSVFFQNDANTMRRLVTASSQLFAGFAIQQTGNNVGGNNSTPFFAFYGDTGTTQHMNLRLLNTTLQLFRGGTLVATSAIPLVNSAWNYVEMSATVDSTVGTVTVKVNGVTAITFTGNTKNGGTNLTLDTVWFAGIFAGFGNYYDDLYVLNSSGATNNTFLGDVRIQTLLPTGAGSSTQLTPTGSGTNYLNVNEVPDNASTYNGSATTGQRDTYAMADLLASTGTIFGVQQANIAFKSDAGAASMKAAQKSGATVSYGATVSLGTSSATYLDLFETNPATTVAWTVSDVNALEAGAEVV